MPKILTLPATSSSPYIVRFTMDSVRKASISFFDDKTCTGFGLFGEHGPKPSEVYSFVGSIPTVAAAIIFLVWDYVPESWLHSVGIYYYPSREISSNIWNHNLNSCCITVLSSDSTNLHHGDHSTDVDEYSWDLLSPDSSMEGEEKPIEHISNIGLDKIKEVMFDAIT
ncbi:hypothetical protein AHAS_Ahas06G0146400 [Arachis hypogaea]